MKILRGFLLALLALPMAVGCNRTATNKLIGGTDASGVAAEAASVQAVEDIWSVTKVGSSVSGSMGAFAAPCAAGTPCSQAAGGAAIDAVTYCKNTLSSYGFRKGSDGFYTIPSNYRGGLNGILKMAFLAGTTPVDLCESASSINGFRIKYNGTLSFGDPLNLDLTFTSFTAPVLNGTINGSVSGLLFTNQFVNCTYSSLGRATPTSGTWRGSFGTYMFNIHFSNTGGSGTMIGGQGRLYRINITTGGTLTIS